MALCATCKPEYVAAEILGYLHAHPKAADTVQGIADWWLPRQRLTESLQTVDAALRLLVAQGRVRKHQLADGQTTYGIRSTQEDTNER